MPDQKPNDGKYTKSGTVRKGEQDLRYAPQQTDCAVNSFTLPYMYVLKNLDEKII